ncbi:MAG: polysaccharide deacetylase family protein [Chloroflexia bacterium]
MRSPVRRWILVGLVLLIGLCTALLIRGVGDLRSTPTVRPTPSSPPTLPHGLPSPSPTAPSEPSPSPSPSPPPSPTPLPPVIGYTAHRVQEGDTLEKIARRYGSLVQGLLELNRLRPGILLAPGQGLIVPLYAGLEPQAPFETHGIEVTRGIPGGRIALTFDAGAASEPAVSILDTLRERGITVTFFLTGQWAEENPDLVRRMAAEGHEIGNHTYSHPRLTELGDTEIHDEIMRTEAIVEELTGRTTRPYLRPPYGARDARVLDRLATDGFLCIYWALDSLDSVDPPKTVEFLVDRVTHPTDSQGRPIPLDGAIVLLHVGSATTAQALPAILDGLEEQGLRVVPLSVILQQP